VTLRDNFRLDCGFHLLKKASLRQQQQALAAWRRYSEIGCIVSLQHNRCGKQSRPKAVAMVPLLVPSIFEAKSVAAHAMSTLEEARTKLAIKLEAATRRADSQEAGRCAAEAAAANWKSEAERARNAIFSCAREWSTKRKNATARAEREEMALRALVTRSEDKVRALLQENNALKEKLNEAEARKLPSVRETPLLRQRGVREGAAGAAGDCSPPSLEQRYGEIVRTSEEGSGAAGALSLSRLVATGATPFFLSTPLPPPKEEEGHAAAISGELPFQLPPRLVHFPQDEDDVGEVGQVTQQVTLLTTPLQRQQQQQQQQLQRGVVMAPHTPLRAGRGRGVSTRAGGLCFSVSDQQPKLDLLLFRAEEEEEQEEAEDDDDDDDDPGATLSSGNPTMMMMMMMKATTV